MSQPKGQIPSHIKPDPFEHPGKVPVLTLCEVEDLRQPSCNFCHSIGTIIFTSPVGVLCGAIDWEEILQAAKCPVTCKGKKID